MGLKRAIGWLVVITACCRTPPVSAADSADLQLRVSAEPAFLLLPTERTVTLHLEVHERDGTPVAGARPAIMARKGRVSPVREVGGGRYQATYHPPSERYPQLEILAIRLDDRVSGFLPIPLHGTGTLEVATRPRAQVRLQVGGEVFGPVQADARGRARLVFTAPPGVSTGTLLTSNAAVAGEGKASRKEVSLGVPQVRPVLLLAAPDELVADGESRARLEMFVLGEDNRPLAGARVIVHTEAGSVSAPVEIRPGWYRARVSAPARVGNGSCNLRAEVEGLGDAYRAAVRIGLRPGPPARAGIVVRPRPIAAGGDARALVEVTVSDRSGNPVSRAGVHLDVSQGRVEPAAAEEEGRWAFWLSLPERGAPRELILTVTVVAPGAQALKQRVRVPVVPAETTTPRPGEQEDGLAAWRWVTLGAGTAALIPGLVLIGIHGRESCDGPAEVRCPHVYDTATAGWVFTGAGAALLATGVVLSLLAGDNPGDHDRDVTTPAFGAGPVPGGMLFQGRIRF